jgi:RNA polymerase sigma-70 factor, ECF subfamily
MPNQPVLSISDREELVKYVRVIIGDEPHVEDIVQDAILVSLEKNESLRDKDNYRQWLFKIARNKALDLLKQKSSQKGKQTLSELEIIDAHLDSSKSLLTLAENNTAIYNEIKNQYINLNKSISEIKAYLAQFNPDTGLISDEHLEILLLQEFEEISQQQIADLLGIPLSTAKSRIQRAREKVKEVFFKCCRFEFDSRGGITDYVPHKK